MAARANAPLVLGVLLLMVVQARSQSYMLVFPNTVRPGSHYEVFVKFLKPVMRERVEAKLVVDRNRTVASGVLTLGQGSQVGTIDFMTPTNMTWSSYQMVVTGKGSVDFSNATYLSFSMKSRSVFIHTDKGVYKTGQTVMYRVFVLDSAMKMTDEPFDVEIFDPRQNKISEVMGVKDKFGMSGELELSAHTPLGRWTIEVTMKNPEINERYAFRVEEYVLPKFDVVIDVPRKISTEESKLDGKLTVKYTYGKPVKGLATITADFSSPWYRNIPFIYPRAVQIQVPVDGDAEFSFPMEALQRLEVLRHAIIQIEANITETLTGKTARGTANAIVASPQNYITMRFNSFSAGTFRPGYPYKFTIEVLEDDQPIAPSRERLRLITTYNIRKQPGHVTPPSSSVEALVTFISPLVNATVVTAPDTYHALSRAGTVEITRNIPDGVVSGFFEAVYKNARSRHEITSYFSPSKSYLVLGMRTRNVKVGQMAAFSIQSNRDIPGMVTYHVTAKGRMIETHYISIGPGIRSQTFYVEVTTAMVPEAHIVAHYETAEGEIVADKITVKVDDLFENKVTVDFSKTRVEPNTDVSLTVQADPSSLVNVLVVDKSVLLMETSNRLTPSKVKGELDQYVRNYGNSAPTRLRDNNSKRMFEIAGLEMVSDNPEYLYHDVNEVLQSDSSHHHGAFAARSGGGMGSAPGRVREYFPETWLWVNASVSSSGQLDIPVTVPDTITDWVATAFALNRKSGLGVALEASNLTAFQSFFVSLQLPYSVIRGEIVVVQANVFNYHSQDMYVTVKLKSGNESFVGIKIDQTGKEQEVDEDMEHCILVKSNDAVAAYFTIKPTLLGMVPLTVTAVSPRDKDSVRRQLLVKPEGKPEEENTPLLVSLPQTTAGQFHTMVDVPIHFPGDVVPGSQKIIAKVIGDIFGPSMEGLEELIRIPSGCGEQNMVTFAPAVYAAEYLVNTFRYTPDLREKIMRSLTRGYQGELLYLRNDGSFSAFGNADDSGSLWLTAFVLKSFAQASDFIFIDPKLVNKSASYIMKNQNEDGSFNLTGIVHHKAMQGGSAASNRSLAAYVLIALREVQAQEILKEDHDIVRLRASILSATSYLTSKIVEMKDDYEMAISAYAFALLNRPEASTLLTKLNASANAVRNVSTLHWKDDVATHMVEVAAYAMLATVELGRNEAALPILRWLVKQRNPYGGFKSTQDTVVALQGLGKMAEVLYQQRTNMTITLITPNNNDTVIHVNNANFDILQVVEVPATTNTVSVKMEGYGIGLVEIGKLYNVMQESKKPTFELNVTTDSNGQDVNRFTVRACGRWLGEGNSGMVLLDIGLPSGYSPLMNTVDKSNPLIKRVEEAGGRVVIYFDEMTGRMACSELVAEREEILGNVQSASVRIYSYYDTDKSVLKWYLPDGLGEKHLCDVCGVECGCKPDSSAVPQSVCTNGFLPRRPTTRRTWIPQEWRNRLPMGGSMTRSRSWRWPGAPPPRSRNMPVFRGRASRFSRAG